MPQINFFISVGYIDQHLIVTPLEHEGKSMREFDGASHPYACAKLELSEILQILNIPIDIGPLGIELVAESGPGYRVQRHSVRNWVARTCENGQVG